jgi:hypothetical protein
VERFIAAARVRARVPPKFLVLSGCLLCVSISGIIIIIVHAASITFDRDGELKKEEVINKSPHHEMACLSLKISILITFFFYIKFEKKQEKRKNQIFNGKFS